MKFCDTLVVWMFLIFELRLADGNLKCKPKNRPGETLIQGCTWTSLPNKPTVQDYNRAAELTEPAGVTQYFYSKCPGVYQLTTIQLLARGKSLDKQSGMNETYQVYTNDVYFNPCSFNINKDWKLCKRDVTFNKNGKTVNFACEPGAATAQYVMFERGSINDPEHVTWPYATRICLFGVLVANSTMTLEPKDENPTEHYYKITRKAVFGNIPQFIFEPSVGAFQITDKFRDVALLWKRHRIMALACNRGGGRIVAILGTRWLEELNTAPYLANMTDNLLQYLGNDRESKLVHADQQYQPGDVVVVMRNQTFDVEKLKSAVLQGTNGIVVAYSGSRQKEVDDATLLIEQLNVTVVYRKRKYRNTIVNPMNSIDSNAYIPLLYELKHITDSWNAMCTSSAPIDFVKLKRAHLAPIQTLEFQAKLKEMLLKYRPYFVDRFPCTRYPYNWEPKTKLAWYNYNTWSMLQMSNEAIPLPGTNLFPGSVGSEEKPTIHRVTLRPPKRGSFNPTGVYVNPGTVFKWRVLNHTHDIEKYRFVFGCQKDNIYKKQPWKRWPRYMHTLQLSSEGNYATPVGGTLFLATVENNQSITLELHNVYRHPWFDLRNKSSVHDWVNERKRYNGVPWLVFIGDVMHTCLPTKAIVKLNTRDMNYLANYLDNVVKIIHNFRGSIWEDGPIQVYAADVQLSAGSGHSGIPIMSKLSWCKAITNVSNLKQNTAHSLTHELGHNLNNGAVTFKKGVEVTVNVNQFVVRGHLANLTAYGFNVSWGFKWTEVNQVIDTWKQDRYNGVNLGYYNWLGMIFGEGLLANIWNLAWHNREVLQTEEQKTNFWLKTLCTMTEYNLLPWQELWHFPIDEDTREVCAKYPCFFPDDELTERVPDTVEKQLAKCSGTVDRQPKKQIQTKADLYRGLNSQRETWITFL